MALTKEFDRLLEQVMERRTDAMRRIVIPTRGAPKKMNKRVRDGLRARLLDSASEILVREKAWKEFQELATHRQLRHIAGYGIRGRFDNLYSWARKSLRGHVIYSFWKGKSCLYVGKGKSYKRLIAYKNSHYLMVADSLEAWQVRSPSKLASAECLAVHFFRPRLNENKPAKVKWGKKCPVCRRHDELKEDLDSLLRLKA
jgi:ribosomal protein L33